MSLSSLAMRGVIEALTSSVKEACQEGRSESFVRWRLIGIHLERKGEESVLVMAQHGHLPCAGRGQGTFQRLAESQCDWGAKTRRRWERKLQRQKGPDF